MIKEEAKLDEIVDLKLLQEVCRNLKGGKNKILDTIADTMSYRVIPEAITNRAIMLIYQKEFEDPSFPYKDAQPKHLRFGAKSFLAIEEYLYRMGFIEEQKYRSFLENKKR